MSHTFCTLNCDRKMSKVTLNTDRCFASDIILYTYLCLYNCINTVKCLLWQHLCCKVVINKVVCKVCTQTLTLFSCINVANLNNFLHCAWKKWDQNVFCNISYKTRMILIKSDTLFSWINLIHRFRYKLAAKSCKQFPPHLNNVSTLPF